MRIDSYDKVYIATTKVIQASWFVCWAQWWVVSYQLAVKPASAESSDCDLDVSECLCLDVQLCQNVDPAFGCQFPIELV